jgi:hypothetical protein
MALNLSSGDGVSNVDKRMQVLERDLKAAKRGDWNAKKRVYSSMLDILNDFARKRTSANEEINILLDAGKQGIDQAINKFKLSSGADRFQIFALSFIEKKMDNPKSGGFFSKMFGK